jgi:predicted patatin/cPLA2 family phospholipase
MAGDGLACNVHGTALCLEGGGCRGAYTAGVLSALLEDGIYFDYVCGVSAGSSNAACYVSRDVRRLRYSFVDLMGDRRAGGARSFLRHHGYFDADFIYEGTIDDPRAPFDFETFSASEAQIAIQSFERDTGRTVRFRRKDMQTPVELMRRVRASSTMPWLMQPIEVDGKTMLDGGLGSGAGVPSRIALDDGYERLFVVLTQPAGYRKDEDAPKAERMLVRTSHASPYLRQALLTRGERYNAELDELERLEREGKALVVRPESMDVTSTTIDPARLGGLYDQGHDQAVREMPQWRAFLGLQGPMPRPTESVIG